MSNEYEAEKQNNEKEMIQLVDKEIHNLGLSDDFKESVIRPKS
jgi:hypothetical protein